MKIAIGCDHTVTDIKNEVVNFLKEKGHQVFDCGTYDKTRTHYPIYGNRVGQLVAENKVDNGIVICGTGVGISLGASKVKGTRCMLVTDVYTAIKAKEQYNANIIGMGGRVLGIGSIQMIVESFLNTKYQNKNQELIKIIDSQIKNYVGDNAMFDQIIHDWEDGKYCDGEKQEKVPLPKV